MWISQCFTNGKVRTLARWDSRAATGIHFSNGFLFYWVVSFEVHNIMTVIVWWFSKNYRHSVFHLTRLSISLRWFQLQRPPPHLLRRRQLSACYVSVESQTRTRSSEELRQELINTHGWRCFFTQIVSTAALHWLMIATCWVRLIDFVSNYIIISTFHRSVGFN